MWKTGLMVWCSKTLTKQCIRWDILIAGQPLGIRTIWTGVQLEDVKNFFKRWYGPNNAILTISGDISSADALKKAEKYFGTINRGPEVRKMKADVPILATDQYASYRDNVYFPAVFMAYPTPQKNGKEDPALTILSSIMREETAPSCIRTS